MASVAATAALCTGTATVAFVAAVRRARLRRGTGSAADPVAALRCRALPWPVRLLRAPIVLAAHRLDARLRRLPVAPLDRLLRRAGVAELLSGSEMLLLGLPLGVLALPVAALGPSAALGMLVLAAAVPFSCLQWLRRVAAARERSVLRELPFHLDMLALALESGATLLLALRICTPRAPPGPLRDAFEAFTFDLQSGRLRGEALTALQRRVDFDSITALTTAIREAERSGAGLARALRIQADQRRHERFHRAEKLAMQAPVRMLGPLVLCIFPCTFIVIGFVLFVRVSA